jgi:hypothetical protein
MGAIALATGGIFVDRGWVRILGSGASKMEGNLASWNGRSTNPMFEGFSGALIVAHDALGGIFAVNGGAFDAPPGHVHYFAPDTLEWEDLGKGYTDFVRFLFAGGLARFYADYRWPEWSEDVAAISGDRGFSIYPPLWTKEGKDLQSQRRRPVPMTELIGMALDIRRQLRTGPRGSR